VSRIGNVTSVAKNTKTLYYYLYHFLVKGRFEYILITKSIVKCFLLCHHESMFRPKRPRDPNQKAKLIVDITTGQADDTDPAEGKYPTVAVKDQATDRQE
jgi:hypothetical protein